jgi:hypothetical protein
MWVTKVKTNNSVNILNIIIILAWEICLFYKNDPDASKVRD